MSKNCSICSKELKFSNTPSFGSGKLSDGNVLCSSCFKKVNKISPKTASKLKKHSLIEIENLINEEAQKNKAKGSRLEEMKAHIQSLGLDHLSTFFGRKEIKELPDIVSSQENIDNIVQGAYNDGIGILVSTDRRLIFIDKGMLYGLKVEDFPLDKITSIQYETGLIFGKIKIHTSSNTAEIKDVDKKAARDFSEFVRNKLSEPKPTNTENTSPDTLGQLEKLGKLKDSGVISEEEFNEQKKKLLAKL